MVKILQTAYEFKAEIKRLGAVKTNRAQSGPADKPIWFETRNFGWIMSPKDENGKRKLLVQC